MDTNLENELIVMLTHNDYTITDASRIFDLCKHTKARYWGFKDKPLLLDEMKKLFYHMKDFGKITLLEVVSYSEEEGLRAAKIACECKCDILMGTLFSPKILQYCQKNKIAYMPFVGNVAERPSILSGTIEEILQEANYYARLGVDGIDLLGYRYVGDSFTLSQAVVDEVEVPVCLAGSINSIKRLEEVKEIKPWAFTIGSAFFENCFGGTIPQQINFVYDYMKQKIDCYSN